MMADREGSNSILSDGLEALKLVRSIALLPSASRKLTIYPGFSPDMETKSDSLDICPNWSSYHFASMFRSQFSHRT